MKKIGLTAMIAAVLVASVALTGCINMGGAPTASPGDTQEDTSTDTSSGDSWCESSSTWAQSSMMGGEMSGEDYEVNVHGIEEYNGEQMCHVTYTGNTEEGKQRVEYYFTEGQEKMCLEAYEDGEKQDELCYGGDQAVPGM